MLAAVEQASLSSIWSNNYWLEIQSRVYLKMWLILQRWLAIVTAATSPKSARQPSSKGLVESQETSLIPAATPDAPRRGHVSHNSKPHRASATKCKPLNGMGARTLSARGRKIKKAPSTAFQNSAFGSSFHLSIGSFRMTTIRNLWTNELFLRGWEFAESALASAQASDILRLLWPCRGWSLSRL